jgi:hypothetical protein
MTEVSFSTGLGSSRQSTGRAALQVLRTKLRFISFATS